MSLLEELPFVSRVVRLEETGSTNDDVRRLASEGAPEGTVVIAARQTAGRGRRGRVWESPGGMGLYLSILLRPTDAPALLGRYGLAAAVAVAETGRQLVDDRIVLKWPNDVLAGRRKLAGILAESRMTSAGPELILGIGVNVLQRPEDFSHALSDSATSLSILLRGKEPDRESVAAALLSALGTVTARLRAGGWPDVLSRFLRYAPDAVGRRVRIGSGEVGITAGLDETGALRIETAHGIRLAHASDSVTPVEE